MRGLGRGKVVRDQKENMKRKRYRRREEVRFGIVWELVKERVRETEMV